MLHAMKTTLRHIAGFALAAVIAVAATAFEGRVSLGMKSGRDKEQVIDYAMKEGFVRMEPKSAEAGGSAMIMDWGRQQMIMLMPEQHMFMVMPLKAPLERAAARAQNPETKVEKTGRTETILGYLCEEYVTTERGETTEMWITDQLGSFAGLGGGNPMAGMMGGGAAAKPAAGGWEQALKGRPGAFPLRVVSRDGKGRETFRLEAKKIEPGSLPDSLFAPPAGYQKFSLPGFGG